MTSRPKFREQTCLDGQLITPPLETEDGTLFTPIISCRAYFAVEFVCLLCFFFDLCLEGAQRSAFGHG